MFILHEAITIWNCRIGFRKNVNNPIRKICQSKCPWRKCIVFFFKSQLLSAVYDSCSSKSCSGHQTRRTKHLSCQVVKADNEIYTNSQNILCVSILYVRSICTYTQAFKLNHLIKTFIIYQNFIISRLRLHSRPCKIKLPVSLLRISKKNLFFKISAPPKPQITLLGYTEILMLQRVTNMDYYQSQRWPLYWKSQLSSGENAWKQGFANAL